MIIMQIYNPSMQTDVESCFEACMTALGWGYQPHGRHSDILDIEGVYIRHGRFWCLFDDDKLIGGVVKIS